MKIALGAAKGLAYLHSPEAKVIYRDFKSSNILIDSVCGTFQLSSLWLPEKFIIPVVLLKNICCYLCQNYNAKLSDFGLAKDGPRDGKSHVSTRVMGTYGYAAPEYMATGTRRFLKLLKFTFTCQSSDPRNDLGPIPSTFLYHSIFHYFVAWPT